MKKVLQNKSEDDEKRMAQLEEQLKDARYFFLIMGHSCTRASV
jgi:hypothetical protein